MRARAVVLVAILLAACGGKKAPPPSGELWEDANQAYGDEAFEIAVDGYKKLLDQYPFDPNAEEAQLKIASSYYLSGRYPEAIAAFGDFERIHPTSPNLPYVEYHLGMSYLAQATTSDRDQGAATNALTVFRNLVDRFPGNPWAERATLRVRECREYIAKHDTEIALYYLRHGNLKAAESRLRGVLENYPDTDATAQALYHFGQAYEVRDEREGAMLAFASLARLHPDGTLGAEARAKVGTDSPFLQSDNPVPLLIARIDRMSTEADRQNAPSPVSAYPNAPSGSY